MSKLEHLIKWPRPGRYIVAVSGGLDSRCLIDLLARSRDERDYELVVAHFDHGWRPESAEDAKFVENSATKYDIRYISERTQLSLGSEATARVSRYDFLERIRRECDAIGIITAQHLDDRLETMVFNVLRGGGIYGQTSLRETSTVLRPLAGVRRADLEWYAHGQRLEWREDSSNADQKYARNFIRHELLPNINRQDGGFGSALTGALSQADSVRADLIASLDEWTAHHVKPAAGELSWKRQVTTALELGTVSHIFYQLAHQLDPSIELSSHQLQAAAVFARVAPSGKRYVFSSRLQLVARYDTLAFICLPG